MPVILQALPDPTDVVVPGSRLAAAPPINVGIDSILTGLANTEAAQGAPFIGTLSEPIEEAAIPDSFWPDPPGYSHARLQSAATGQPWQNVTICSPAGALIVDTFMAGPPILGAPFMSTTRWQIIGVSRDSVGVALPSCRVIVVYEGYLYVAQGSPVVAETISSAVDGSFTIDVPGNGNYCLIAYKPGDPATVAGVTLFNLVMTSPG